MDVVSEKSILGVAEKITNSGWRVGILIKNAAINPTANSLEGEVRTTRLKKNPLERWNVELSVGLTRYLSSYWAKNGVRCNALSPGGIYYGQSQEFVGRLEKLIPLGRMAAKDEYIGVVQFLCSDASAYLTGQNLVIDGGWSII